MAEFEPAGEPVEVAVPTTPVQPPPAEGGGNLPSGAQPPRRTGLLRWGIALVVLAVMVGAVSVAVALMAGSPGASSVEGWLPADTIGYLELRADLPGDQRANAGDLLAKFPGFADQASNDAKIDEALDKLLEKSGVSWTGDLKPWVAGEVGFAVTKAAFDLAGAAESGAMPSTVPDDGGVLLAGLKDPAAAQAWLTKETAGTATTVQYAGGDLTRVERSGSAFFYAIRKNVLILGPEKTVKAALDTGGASPLPKSDTFAAAAKTAPDAYLGFGYLDVKSIYTYAMKAAAGQGGTASACLPDANAAAVPAWVAGFARAEDGAIALTGTSPTAGTPPTATGSASGAAAHLPATTIAAVEVRDLGPAISAGLDALKKQLDCDPAAADAWKQVEQGLAILGGIDGLVGWAGDAALAATVDGSTIGGGLAAVATDAAAAARTLDQVKTLLALAGAQAGVQTRQEAYGGANLLVITMPSAGGVPEIAATVADGVFALGTIDFVKAVVDTKAGSSLADGAVYKRAVQQAGGDGVADVFVDIAGLRAAVEAQLPAAEKARYETDIKPFVTPFEAFASVVKAPSTTATVHAVVTFAK